MYMYVCTYVHMYVCMCVCVCMYVHVCMYVCMYVCTGIMLSLCVIPLDLTLELDYVSILKLYYQTHFQANQLLLLLTFYSL